MQKENVSVTLNIQHDGPLSISVGTSAKSKNWIREDTTWKRILERLQIPPVSDMKDVGGYVGGILQGSSRAKGEVVYRQLLTLDLDNAKAPRDVWTNYVFTYWSAGVLHSTYSHTADAPRYRLIIPLAKELTPRNYTKVAQAIVNELGPENFDRTTVEANRLMFWSALPYAGAPWDFEVYDADWLNPDPILQKLKQDDINEELSRKMSASLLGSAFEFCKKYNIHDAIANWLSDIYEPVGERYRLIGADSGAGVQIYDDGRHCYSHHAKDVAGGIVCNAFDLVRIHKFGHLDASPKVASPDMESYKAMEAWIVDNALCPVVKQALDLRYDANGKPQSTSDNMITVLKGDPELNEGGDTFYYDMFRDNIMVCGDLPWKPLVDRGLSAGWSDVDDAGIRNFFERKYGMVDRGKTLDALMLTAEERRIHPIRDYLHAKPWDGTPRADTLLIDYLQAEDTPYTRTVTRKALLGAVARVMQPGCKHDHVLVLVGPQGCGKSTLINKLGGKYFTDSLSTMQGKEACELLQGYWIVELSEMTAVRKSEMDQIKQFISKTTDNYRAAYARTTKDRPRQCAFIGSTNEEEFLRDPTGNRRFWPVGVSQSDITKLDALTEDVIQQVWAEILVAYKAGEKWHLNPQEEKDAKEQQDSRRVVDPKQGQLELWLESDVPEGWNNTPASERMMWYSAPQKTGIKRRQISASEIWKEHYGMRDADLSRVKAMEINDMLARLPGWRRARITSEVYGQQRGFIRE